LYSIDGYALSEQRRHSDTNLLEALAAFGDARPTTLELMQHLIEIELKRRGWFEGCGDVTLKALIQFLCRHDQQHLACVQRENSG